MGTRWAWHLLIVDCVVVVLSALYVKMASESDSLEDNIRHGVVCGNLIHFCITSSYTCTYKIVVPV